MPRCGLAAIAGLPNAGKSTLLNTLVGQRLALTSEKPQSTRERVVGIITRDDVQTILIDTPGILEVQSTLHRAMRAATMAAINDADVIVHLVDAHQAIADDPFSALAALGRRPSVPILAVFNKVDLVRDDALARLVGRFPDALLVSSTTGRGIAELLRRIESLLPESHFLYDAGDISAQPLRFFVAEFVREAALEQLRDEVPYSIACTIEEFREERNPMYIRAVLYVERASQKRILIGKGGSRIREIGRTARLKSEALTGAPVYLDLWVKVLENWRRDANALRRLGYPVPEERKP
jgi:GTP-binding protein Era